MAIRTRFTEAFGIEAPIVQGGMQGVGRAGLAAAVSNAGGLGILTGLTQPSSRDLADEIARTRAMTAKPFAVNLTVFPSINPPPYRDYAQAIIDGGIGIVETAGPKAMDLWPMLKAAGIRIVHKCTSVRHAVSAEAKGVDAISIDGFECAGHPGEDDIPGLVLIPAAADRLRVPMIASGGIADGRGLAAALALGADGVNMGTRFCATREAAIHPNLKQAYLDNDERGTNLIFRKFKNTARVGKSAVSDEVVRLSASPDATFKDIAHLVSGAQGRKVLEDGDMSAGVFWASMAQGLIHDIPTVAELMARMVEEAERIIAGRLAGFLGEPESTRVA